MKKNLRSKLWKMKCLDSPIFYTNIPDYMNSNSIVQKCMNENEQRNCDSFQNGM